VMMVQRQQQQCPLVLKKMPNRQQDVCQASGYHLLVYLHWDQRQVQLQHGATLRFQPPLPLRQSGAPGGMPLERDVAFGPHRASAPSAQSVG
jgi:hypothetical protein